MLNEIIGSFSKSELKEFTLFVRSPFFNREKVLQRYADMLYASFPDFEKRNELVFKTLYPGKVYNDGLLRNTKSDLLRLAEKFLSAKEFFSSDAEVKKKLVSQLGKRNLGKYGLKHLSLLRSNLDTLTIKDGDYYLEKFNVEKEYLSLSRKSKDKYLRETDQDVVIENLMIFFMINFINQCSQKINRGKIISDRERVSPYHDLIDQILEGCGKHLLDIPNIRIVYYIYKLLKDEDERFFRELKKMVAIGTQGFPQPLIHDVISAASNFAYLKVLSGDRRYLIEQHELIVHSVKSGFYTKSLGYLPFVTYLNAVITGLEAGKTAEAKAFAERYHSDLTEDCKRSALHFSNGLIFYKMKDYGRSLSELSLVATEDYSFKQQIKSLYLKIYYDLNDVDSFYYHADSYKHFIAENKMIHKIVRNQLSHYLKYTKKLFALKNSEVEKREFELSRLENDIKVNPSLINREWLLEKAKEISGHLNLLL